MQILCRVPMQLDKTIQHVLLVDIGRLFQLAHAQLLPDVERVETVAAKGY